MKSHADPCAPVPNLGPNGLQRRVKIKGQFEQVLHPENFNEESYFLVEIRREVAFGLALLK